MVLKIDETCQIFGSIIWVSEKERHVHFPHNHNWFYCKVKPSHSDQVVMILEGDKNEERGEKKKKKKGEGNVALQLNANIKTCKSKQATLHQPTNQFIITCKI